jgi:hypothetical protein
VRRLFDLVPILLATVAAALLLTPLASADLAEQLQPLHLRVADGEVVWHADNEFQLNWDPPPVAAQGFPVTAVDYRIRNSAGAVVAPEVHLPWDIAKIAGVRVPSPGIYIVDVWLEGPGRQRGPSASATLRFDDVRPGAAQPLSPSGWFAGNEASFVAVGNPLGPQPLSGIRGYAVSVDRSDDYGLCGGRDRCSLAETESPGGSDGDRLALGMLPEGGHVVRVVAVSGAGTRSAETRSVTVRVDASRPAVALAGVPRDWANGPVRLTAKATDSLSGMVAGGPSGPYTAISVDGSVPKAELGDSATAIVNGEGSHSVTSYARDAAGNVDPEAPFQATVRIDEGPPQVAFANSQDRADPERIEAYVSDSRSGPDPTRGSIELRLAGSRQPFAALPTVVASGVLVARWNSDASAAGTYEFRATAYDAAGNSTSSERRRNGARLVLMNPLKTQTKISAGFGGRHLVWQRCARREGQRRCHRQEIEAFENRPTSRAVPYGRGISYAGRLTSVAGAPLGGLPVEVIETFVAGDSPQRTTTVETAADGTFLARLAPGPSRRVDVAFAGDHTLSRVSGTPVRLRVLGGVRMHASSGSARIGGAPVVFRGRVGDLGAPIPPGGRPVELQFRFPGSEWSEFRTVQTDARGRFHYPYSFSDDDSRGIQFQFRAYAPALDDWPYEPAFSRPVFVTGR